MEGTPGFHDPLDNLIRHRNQLIDLVYNGTQDYKPKQVFVTMGEERASLFLTQRLRDYLGVNAIAPEPNAEIEIDF